MVKKILKRIRYIHYILLLLKEDRESVYKVNFTERIKSLMNGFSSDKKTLYRYTKENMKDYLSDYDRLKTMRINKTSYQIFNDKLLTERVLSSFVKYPTSYGVIKNRKLISLTEEIDDQNYESIIDLLYAKNTLVIKPISEGGGKGVHLLKYDQEFYIDNSACTREELIKFLSNLNNYLITEFIRQGEFSKELFPESTNTIRVLTMIDPENNEPFVAKAAQRIGNHNTKPIDNFGGGKGGLNSKIDLKTGKLQKPVMFSIEGEYIEIDKHPDTGVTITGKVIPHWDEIVEDILSIIKKNPFITYAGWDIVVTDEGYAVIEINNYSGMVIFQVHEPILNNERIIKFYKYHNIIK